MVLDGYHLHEVEQKRELRIAERERGAKVACGRGCFVCCLNAEVPVMQHEVRAILWFLTSEISDDVRERIKPRMLGHEDSPECPFLLEGACSIYPVRPLGCRDFVVFRKPCGPGEDIAISRPHDIFTAPASMGRKVGLRVLDAVREWPDPREKQAAFEAGVIPQLTRPMHTIDWAAVAEQLP